MYNVYEKVPEYIVFMFEGEPSVFKASDNGMREEVRGAEEVAEDENTAVELPVDQVLSFSFLSSSILSFISFVTTESVCYFREHQKQWRMRSFPKDTQPI